MNEFLFSFLNIKILSKWKIFYFGEELKIKVEILNTFFNYRKYYLFLII